MKLRPYDIELLRGKVARAATEETVILKAELLTELLNHYEDADPATSDEVEELKEALAEAEDIIEKLEYELDAYTRA